MGRNWYEDGKLLKKKNTFTDFIAAGEYLAQERYTSRGRIVANGGGSITVDSTGKLTLNQATVTGGTVTDNGEIDLTGSGVIKSGTLGNTGQIKVSNLGNALSGVFDLIFINGAVEEGLEPLMAKLAPGGRIIAVGTTSLRLLESAADDARVIHPFSGDTAIFITPGYRFKGIDGLVTNFHLPKSTLFMLVSALMGLDRMQAAYAHAIANEYRFYSYGDSSLLLPDRQPA